MTILLIWLKIHKNWSYFRILKALKQIFRLKNIPCVYLNDILNRMLAKVCLGASFMSLFPFLAFLVTFNDLCC